VRLAGRRRSTSGIDDLQRVLGLQPARGALLGGPCWRFRWFTAIAPATGLLALDLNRASTSPSWQAQWA